MTWMTSEEERQLIADAEAARDDPDSPLLPSSLTVADDAGVVLTVHLRPETMINLERAAKAREGSISELLDHTFG